ncbi:ribonuclease HII [[Acholeplasma] multilocale]|uniref:ribonuclease HII n=1 Tax=[Acholeplasma] multilocale TaxID=264638 RepID=UPI000421E40F|nr:ribonuclease HII [[Acholeplasma] multilocale]
MIDNSRIDFDNQIRKDHNLEIISGSDEAGRGAMAGPVVVATVILPSDYQNPLIKDSKKINEVNRNKLYEEIIKIALDYKVEIFSAQQVDELNPKRSSVLGMINSIKKLKIKPEISLIDGEKLTEDGINSIQLIKGDDKSQTIAAASIIAKVTRDRMMIEYAKQFPNYDFDKHKGYCTKGHYQKLDENGITEIHRISYKPVYERIKK